MRGSLSCAPSPYASFPAQPDTNLLCPVSIGVNCGMVFSVPNASRSELRATTMGQVDVAALGGPDETVAFVHWRCKSTVGTALHVRAPMHALLMDISLSELDPSDILGLGKACEVALIVQDETLLRALRIVRWPKPISDLLAPVLLRQLSDQHFSRRDIAARVEAQSERYMQLYPSPEDEFNSSIVQGITS